MGASAFKIRIANKDNDREGDTYISDSKPNPNEPTNTPAKKMVLVKETL